MSRADAHPCHRLPSDPPHPGAASPPAAPLGHGSGGLGASETGSERDRRPGGRGQRPPSRGLACTRDRPSRPSARRPRAQAAVPGPRRLQFLPRFFPSWLWRLGSSCLVLCGLHPRSAARARSRGTDPGPAERRRPPPPPRTRTSPARRLLGLPARRPYPACPARLLRKRTRSPRKRRRGAPAARAGGVPAPRAGAGRLQPWPAGRTCSTPS